MRRHKSKLKPAAEKSDRDHQIVRIPDGTQQNGTKALFDLLLAGAILCLHERQQEQAGHDHCRKDKEDRRPMHDIQQRLCQRWPDHLPKAAGSCCQTQRQRPAIVGCGASNHTQNHPEPGAGNTKTDKDLDQLMPQRRCGIGAEDKTSRIEDGANNNGPPVAKPFGHRPEKRRPQTPGKVLNSYGQRKFTAEPVHFCRNGNLKHPETGANRKAQEQHTPRCNQHRCHDGTDRGHFNLSA